MRWIILLLVFVQCSARTENEWQEIFLTDMYGMAFSATSVLDQDNGFIDMTGRYGPLNLFDRDLETVWAEGAADDGAGEAVFITIPENCRTITVFPGHGKSSVLFENNNRIRTLKIKAFAGINPEGYVSEIGVLYRLKAYPEEAVAELKDIPDFQTIDFPFSHSGLEEFADRAKEEFSIDFPDQIAGHTTLILKLEIESVYKGEKWDDTCISEILFNDEYMVNPHKIKYPEVTGAYVDNENEQEIYIDIPGQEAISVFQDDDSVLQIIEISDNMQWMTLVRMPVEPGGSRVETEYLLFHNGLAKVMNEEIERVTGRKLTAPFFLDSENGLTLDDGDMAIKLY